MSGINDLVGDINNGKTHIKATIDSMNAIEAEGGDTSAEYATFQKDMGSLNSIASKARSQGQSMREQGAAYFKAWEEQLGTMTNADIKKRSEERRAALNEQYSKLTSSMDTCRQKYEQLSNDLKDIKTALDVDLSPGGVKALSKPMKSARSAATDVTKALDDLSQKLDALAKEMNTIKAAAPAKT